MIEDRLLIRKFKRGSRSALQRIYEKYRGYLLTLATALLNDVNSAEDVVHDFFVSFAQSADSLKTDGSLKWYLATCVANRAKDRLRAAKRQAVSIDFAEAMSSDARGPASSAICNEQLQMLNAALAQIPYEQKEVVILHARGQMRFRAIAKMQDVSIKTVQSRYRYGLDKLRIILDKQVK
ncbi:MAG TPA: RNA polymerase sigma factor [Phycisphaerales bacterium]|nr:RNA polymerase sigma factor [Phycisphaerales bacterium]